MARTVEASSKVVRPARSWASGLFGALVASAALVGGGCAGHSEGGSGASIDKHVFVSTSWDPKTVEVIDTRDGSTIWTSEVPVGKKLVMRFKPADDTGDPARPDRLWWMVIDASASTGSPENTIPVPDRSSRLLKWSLRPAPEYPPTAAAPATEG